MKRVKHHKIKKEKAECSTHQRVQEEHDLAYYIHDRVELMHQVFSILKYKELKSMAPESVKNLAIGDLEELCTEELLGISSKRLLAILDGVEPPSDTESSSPSPPPEQLETISLDSISSDEELLASNSKKKKHKHRHRSSKSKSKKKEKPKERESAQIEESSELSKASRAGLTVLELLELQARARAIRAQLQQEQANKQPSETIAAESSHHSSENEIEIKEEPPDVVEISSEDEKPDVNQLKKNIVDKSTPANTEPEKETVMTTQFPKTITKRINDLVITVPQAVTTRKIKLNRSKVTALATKSSISVPNETRGVTIVAPADSEKTDNNSLNISQKSTENKPKKKKKGKKKKPVDKDASDHDEITLQLSDSEKMDLLEDLDESRKNYDRVSSSTEDTESSSSDSDDDKNSEKASPLVEPDALQNEIKEKEQNKPENTSILTLTSRQKDQNLEQNTVVEIPTSVHNNESPPVKNIKENSCTNDSKSFEANNKNESDAITNVPKHHSDSNVNPNQILKNTLIEKNDNIINKKSPEDKTDNHPEPLSSGNKTVGDSEKHSPSKSNLDKLGPGNSTNDHSEELTVEAQSNDHSKELSPEVQTNDHSKELSPEVQINDHSKKHSPGDKSKDQNKDEMLLIETTDSTDQTVQSYKTLRVTSSIDTRCVKLVDQSFGDEISSSNNDSTLPNISEKNVMEINLVEGIAVSSDNATNSSDKKSQKDFKSTKESELDLSDGELSDRQSSEVEAVDVQPEVVCISDEESPKKKIDKKKKKKEKKSKKEKKAKKSKSDFREGSDQNFYKDANLVSDCDSQHIIKCPTNETTTVICDSEPIDLDTDDVYEYLELSDDSSCYEVEGTVLSKEPTAEEIEALSAKIDEIERLDVVTDEQIRENEQIVGTGINEPDEESIENISWKDRYLGSKKVKKVLTTANILNALRNKNKKLKKKIQESKKTEEKETLTKQDIPKDNDELEEGSIEQYNALQGSTKYVDPIKEPVEENKGSEDSKEQTEKLASVSDENNVTREMKKDARQLLKMYRRLLKHNDMNKQKDPNKKKKQKKRDKQAVQNNIVATTLANIDGTIT